MNLYRKGIILLSILALFVFQGCELLSPKQDSPKKASVIVTVMNPGNVPISSIELAWGDSTRDAPDDSRTLTSSITFPYQFTISDARLTSNFLVAAEVTLVDGDPQYPAQIIDTSNGGPYTATFTVTAVVNPSATVHTTTTNPSNLNHSSIVFLWGDTTMEPSLDNSFGDSNVTFPYNFTITNATRTPNFFVVAITDGGLGFALGDTLAGGEFTAQLQLAVSAPSWTSTAALAGGSDHANAVALPLQEKWYTGTLATLNAYTWYKATVVSGTQYEFAVDDGSGAEPSYTAGVKFEFYDSDGIKIGATHDGGDYQPALVTPAEETIWVKIIASDASGTYAIGYQANDGTAVAANVVGNAIKLPQWSIQALKKNLAQKATINKTVKAWFGTK